GSMGVAASISVTPIPMEFRGARWFHLPTAPPTQLMQWIDELQGLNIHPSHVSIDTFETYARRDPEATKAVMQRVGLVFLNGEEYAVMVKYFGEEFFRQFPHVLKLGKRGAVYMDKTKYPEIHIEMPAIKVGVKDTTGAGEVLAGVFDAARVAGLSIGTSLRLAVDTASRSVTKPGVEHIREGISHCMRTQVKNGSVTKKL
ncbi:MAG: carbohydrate kinase family protein, partial [Candidatus Gottesmanbacteria bacterium]|nr:carbohydrate kinase family protein [Candidatus Gottesmanbacteria bacterium]